MAASRPVSTARTALQALLAGEARVAADCGEAFVGPAVRLAEGELARAVRELGPAVVAVREPGPTLLRALRERPPGLLIVVGEEVPAGIAAGRVLGPGAEVEIGAGELVLLASEGPALSGLRVAFAAVAGAGEIARGPGRDEEATAGGRDAGGLAPVRLALCPTPGWLPEWLEAPELAAAKVAGMVAAASLHAGWARWARAAGPRQVVVPLGVAAPQVDRPRDPSLGPAAAAHALERLTGPVFPSPAVLALLLAARDMPEWTGDEGHVQKGMSGRSETTAALWRQARRALALPGDERGMAAPHPGLPPVVLAPTDAFLAQRALLRRERATTLARGAEPEPNLVFDPGALARAEEVLRSAGQVLSEHESKVVLRGFGIEVTRQAVASSASGAAQFAEQIGFPVVLKAVSPDLRRKQELGAVVLDLTTAAAVRRAYATIVANVEERAPTAHLDGVLVAEQIAEGLEIHCGAVALASGETALFGRALTGAHEYVLALSPLDPAEALLLAQAVVAGVPLRRKDDPGLRDLAGLFLRLDALVRHFGAASVDSEGRLELVDLSPVRLCAGPRGYVTLDARIVQRAHLEGL